ncbi:MAG TPA: phosphate ABC transporter permease PstA [Pirellulales bacterium]|jgi:phosphate transport system permease protein
MSSEPATIREAADDAGTKAFSSGRGLGEGAAPATSLPPRSSKPRPPKRRLGSPHTTLAAHGAPLVWLTGGALATALAMIIGLLVLVLYEGLQSFWPMPVTELTVADSAGKTIKLLGEISRSESFRPEPSLLDELKEKSPELYTKAKTEMSAHDGQLRRQLIWTGRTAALDFAGTREAWVNDFAIQSTTHPADAVVIERLDGGRSYGTPKEFAIDGKPSGSTPAEIWAEYNKNHTAAIARWQKTVSLQGKERGTFDRQEHAARLDVISAELALADLKRDHANDAARIEAATKNVEAQKSREAQVKSDAEAEKAKLDEQTKQLQTENDRYELQIDLADSETAKIPLAKIVRAYPANQLSVWGKLGVYFSRWWEFLSADPRESNTEGGVFPAIWGTVAMTLIMSIMVVPFGVLAALYLREYAKAGAIVSIIRISINNLAGVPSIVFGVFGLGLFCYVIGASIDQLFFRAALADNNTPTYGTGGILWASLTLALLTLPVVIVATEEALAAVPNSMREGSYACGASKWQTIRRIVLPRALPGIMTGMILAIARGAGEVAPLMLVGVREFSPALPFDGVFPYIHAQRSFMHLAYQIYYVGFKSQNAEAAKPMVFTATLLLIAIVAALNVAAVYLRTRLRRRFVLNQF